MPTLMTEIHFHVNTYNELYTDCTCWAVLIHISLSYSSVCTVPVSVTTMTALRRMCNKTQPLFPLLQGGSIDVFVYHMHHAGSHYGPGAVPPPLTAINSTLLSD